MSSWDAKKYDETTSGTKAASSRKRIRSEKNQ